LERFVSRKIILIDSLVRHWREEYFSKRFPPRMNLFTNQRFKNKRVGIDDIDYTTKLTLRKEESGSSVY